MLGQEILKVLEETYESLGPSGWLLVGADNYNRSDNIALWASIKDSIEEFYYRDAKFREKLGLSLSYPFSDKEFISYGVIGIRYLPKRKVIKVYTKNERKPFSSYTSSPIIYFWEGNIKVKNLENDDGGAELFNRLKAKKIEYLETQLNSVLVRLGRLDTEIEHTKSMSFPYE